MLNRERIMMNNRREWVGVKEVANLIGRSCRWVYRHISLGDGPTAYRFGTYWRFDKKDVEAWIESRKQ